MADVGLGEDRQPIARAREISLLLGRQRFEVREQRARIGRAHLARQRRQPSAVHVLDDGREADRNTCQPKRPDDMPDVALREPLVVRLGEHLRREQLVRDLGVRPTVVRVVDRLALRIPTAKRPASAGRCVSELLADEVVALGIDVDDTHSALDRGERQQHLQDRLAGPGRAEEQRHDRARPRDRDPDQLALTCEPDRDALRRDPPAVAKLAPPEPAPDGRHRTDRGPALAEPGRRRRVGRPRAARRRLQPLPPRTRRSRPESAS